MTVTERAPAASGQIVTFYSYKGGSGRTMTLANVAWILASNGYRVLVVDWDLESPGLHRYFHPFLLDKELRNSPGVIEMLTGFVTAALQPDRDDELGWIDATAQVLDHAVSLEWRFPGKGGVDLLPSGRQTRSYAAAVSTFDWPKFYDRLPGAAFIDALARNMRQHYDYILVDSRTGLSDAAGVCTVLLPDVVVNCFTLSIQSVDGAVAVSESIRHQRRGRPLRFLPALMRVEDAEQLKLEIGRDYARRRFRPFLEHGSPDEANRYWGDVEVPYKPYFAYEEILATFAERPRLETSLLAAFERLTGVLTQGGVREMPAIDEAERRRWLQKFERPRPSSASDVLISYAAVDRMWAEWIQQRLVDVDMRVMLLDIDSVAGPHFTGELERRLATVGRTLVLLSKDYVSSPQAAPLWALLDSRSSAGTPAVVPIRLDSTRLSPPFTERLPAELANQPRDRAHEALLSALGVPQHSPSGGVLLEETGPRFPGVLPPIWNVPQRNPGFTGRRDTLEQLRDRLSASVTVVVPQALYGLGGVGKTQVAIEYAYRFAADYDLVWWISAEQVSQVRSALGELARELRLQETDTLGESVRQVRDALRQGRPGRWLLIFDNVGDPETIREFIPQGPGHVLLTSRNQEWTQDATVVEITTFSRSESITFLTRRVQGLAVADADAVANRLGDLPLAIEQAAAWLSETGMPVIRYLELLDTQPLRILDENPPVGYDRSTAATWQLSLEQLRKQSPAAAKLLEICAFFAPEPIPTRLLYTPRFTQPLLEYDPALHDPIRQGRLIRQIGRYALASVDSGQTIMQIHRLVQAVIQDSLTPAEREENRKHVYRVLATAERADPDEVASWPAYARLLPHVRGSRANHSSDMQVRLFVVDVVRYLWSRGDFSSSQELAEETVQQWRGDSRIGEDQVTLLLDFHLGNALRSQAMFDRALDIDQRALERLKETVEEEDDPYIVMTAGGVAADLRALGRFEEARVLAEDAYERAQRTFGEDHDRTLSAANNVAVSLRLVGDFNGAANYDEDTLSRRRRVFGERHLYTLLAANNYAHDLRAIGRFEESKELLDKALQSYRALLGDSAPATLRAAKNMAVTLRKLGDIRAARQLTGDTLQRYRDLHGEEHPDTLSCLMNAAFEESALGNGEAAERIARQVLAGYETLYDERHPFRLAALNNLAIFVRLNGAAEAARALSDQAAVLFERALGAEHPYTLSSRINLANALVDAGDLEAARAIDESVTAAFDRVLGPDNPDSLAAAANLVVSRRSTGDGPGADELLTATLDRSRRRLGGNHPNTVAMEEGRRLNCDISPPPT
ncbi:FxSxx-COOH system tetratricopeptide repeat protein [Dactylosporangium sp. NPDC051541]|uniref:FxSxx-COOH system tetratricopeptide repeat protein n=1 Tax=Dactylosporangium sp. NPDC051541 TaxID=3363977 RepID=UPI0037B6F607